MIVHQLPALKDNYIYILQDAQTITVIDPGDSAPVVQFCTKYNYKVDHIILTHHHPDHIGGVSELVKKYNAATWGFGQDKHRLPPLTNTLKNGQQFFINNYKFQVTYAPGHTLGHICYFLPDLKYLFCGDVLFSMGCGRFFEGTAEISLPNFQWIRSLPLDTTIFCSHEYTQVNTEFALSIDSNNKELAIFYENVVEKRKASRPTVPFPLAQEIALNPFLRWDDPELRKNLKLEAASDTETLRTIRGLRNQW